MTILVTTLASVGALLLSLLVCFSVAAAGARVTMPEIGGWYRTLAKPSWTPPSWVFGPVWTVLYLCMAVAAWRVWLQLGWEGGGLPLGLFSMQLGLNLAWSCIFFGMHAPRAALAELGVLWMTVFFTALAFMRIDSLAGALMVPYLVWLSYAGALNAAICRRCGN